MSARPILKSAPIISRFLPPPVDLNEFNRRVQKVCLLSLAGSWYSLYMMVHQPAYFYVFLSTVSIPPIYVWLEEKRIKPLF